MSQNPILTRDGVCTSAKRLNMKLLRLCYNLAVCFVPFERTKKGDSADKTQQFIRQIKAIQPTNRSDSSDKSRRFSRQTEAIQPMKRWKRKMKEKSLKPLQLRGFFVTLKDFSAFLCIKAVWEIEEKQGYELATVLNSTFCYELLSMNTRCWACNHLWLIIGCKGNHSFWKNQIQTQLFLLSLLLAHKADCGIFTGTLQKGAY